MRKRPSAQSGVQLHVPLPKPSQTLPITSFRNSLTMNNNPLSLVKATALLILLGATLSAAPARPVQLILDTDIGNDIDDALALAVIHGLENRGACKLLAVTLTNPEPDAGRFTSVLNTFYGRPDIPIGANPKAPATPTSRYLKIANSYPHHFDPAAAPSALSLLRRTLVQAEDGGVVLVQVGFFTNLAALLDSPPDEISPLSGRELIKAKVRLLSLMAGSFQTVGDSNYFTEYNVQYDIPSARKVAAEWPTPMIWSGVEIGLAVRFPLVAIDNDFASVPRHPIAEAYPLYLPTPTEAACFDLTSVLQAVWPDRDYFQLSQGGRVEVQPDGFTKFTPAEQGGPHRFLAVDATRSLRIRELFSTLVSEPPQPVQSGTTR